MRERGLPVVGGGRRHRAEALSRSVSFGSEPGCAIRIRFRCADPVTLTLERICGQRYPLPLFSSVKLGPIYINVSEPELRQRVEHERHLRLAILRMRQSRQEPLLGRIIELRDQTDHAAARITKADCHPG